MHQKMLRCWLYKFYFSSYWRNHKWATSACRNILRNKIWILILLFFFFSAIEFCGEKHRTYPLFCLMASYGLSSIFTPVLAMYLSSWQSLLMVATIPNIIVIIAGLFSYIPESIRWQVCKGKPYRVLETVQKMAKVNSVEFSVSTYNLLFWLIQKGRGSRKWHVQ